MSFTEDDKKFLTVCVSTILTEIKNLKYGLNKDPEKFPYNGDQQIQAYNMAKDQIDYFMKN